MVACNAGHAEAGKAAAHSGAADGDPSAVQTGNDSESVRSEAEDEDDGNDGSAGQQARPEGNQPAILSISAADDGGGCCGRQRQHQHPALQSLRKAITATRAAPARPVLALTGEHVSHYLPSPSLRRDGTLIKQQLIFGVSKAEAGINLMHTVTQT
ncbi:hypothetical protein MMC14_009650 [Varicellaria rhodocarpa]|nr:hypothetical protein [Varicellaria rhodocarpa]